LTLQKIHRLVYSLNRNLLNSFQAVSSLKESVTVQFFFDIFFEEVHLIVAATAEKKNENNSCRKL